MEIKHVIVRRRALFGKQCIFDDEIPKPLFDIHPDPKLKENWTEKNVYDSAVQVSKQFAAHETQTPKKTFKNSGMFHSEGGWPKEFNPKDEEAIARYRRRIEKSDIWAPQMTKLLQPMQECVAQNNAVNIYENFFDDIEQMEMVKPFDVRTVNTYTDPHEVVRPITHISWTKDFGNYIAVSHCSIEFETKMNESLNSYIWDVENSNVAYTYLNADDPIVTLEFNPRDPSLLIGGVTNGQVCLWDIRTGNSPVVGSHPKYSHRNPANLALWINSKTYSEFFSASSSGCIMWWDYRKLRQPTETLIMDLEDPLRADIVKAIGVSALQFEFTMGTKFMAGMQNGTVISGNRKGQNAQQKMALRFNCHFGPVLSVDRNPFSMKNFLTVDSDSVKIWAEDTKEGCLLKIPMNTSFLTRGCWSTSRYSVFYVITASGDLEVYDLLAGIDAPAKTLNLCEDALKAIAPHDEGKLVAVGGKNGIVYLVELSEALTTSTRNEKSLIHSYFEQCSNFQKAIDLRLKEIRLARRTTHAEIFEDISRKTSMAEMENDEDETDDKKERMKEEEITDDPELANTEAIYHDIIQKEIEKYTSVESEDTGAMEREKTQAKVMIDEAESDKADVRDEMNDKESRGKKLKAKAVETKIAQKRSSEIVVLKRKEYENVIAQRQQTRHEGQPMAENELEVEAGDVENQLEATLDLDRTLITTKDAKASSRMIGPPKEDDDPEHKPSRTAVIQTEQLQRHERKTATTSTTAPEHVDLLSQTLPETVLSLVGITEPPRLQSKDILRAKCMLTDSLNKEVTQAKMKLHKWRKRTIVEKLGKLNVPTFGADEKVSAMQQQRKMIAVGRKSREQKCKLPATSFDLKSFLERPQKERVQLSEQRKTHDKVQHEKPSYPRISAAHFQINVSNSENKD